MEVNSKKVALKEAEDYYIERGLMVFTSEYHLKRGFCCQNACRHCPYSLVSEKSKQTKNHE